MAYGQPQNIPPSPQYGLQHYWYARQKIWKIGTTHCCYILEYKSRILPYTSHQRYEQSLYDLLTTKKMDTYLWKLVLEPIPGFACGFESYTDLNISITQNYYFVFQSWNMDFSHTTIYIKSKCDFYYVLTLEYTEIQALVMNFIYSEFQPNINHILGTKYTIYLLRVIRTNSRIFSWSWGTHENKYWTDLEFLL